MFVLLRDILPILVACCVVLVILLLAEFIRLKQRKATEGQRKFVHILVGCLAAGSPYLLEWWQIQALGVMMLAVVLFAKHFGIFRSIFGVKRHTWGELLFALVFIMVPALTHDPAVFALAMLHMSLADGFAALLGIRYGKSSQYKVFGNTKSLVGTMTFFIISLGLIATYSYLATPLAVHQIALLALLATTLENVGVRGFDNFLVPLAIVLILR